ncbi:hypothetical protein E4U55_008149 [Claviceps digitariae]|nr:hypothetical protein E4U55_008149 [Claviceps digitariae]
MAVLDQIPQIDVSVHINGRPAKEYPPPDQNDDHAPAHPHPDVHIHECYIESQSGQTYTVNVSVSPEFNNITIDAVLCRLSVDGCHINGVVLENSKGLVRTRQYCFKGPYSRSATSKRVVNHKLTFSPVTTVEETSSTILKRDAKIVAALGMIVLEISTCKVKGYDSLQLHRRKEKKAFTIAEKSMKGKELSHGTTFTKGDVMTAVPRRVRIHDEKPIAKYIFRYRSRSALQSEMILPHDLPIQEPSVSNQVLSMTDDEVRALAEKYLRVKREQQQVKLENNATSRHERTIDLTQDDDDDVVEVYGHGKVKVLKLENGNDAVDLT